MVLFFSMVHLDFVMSHFDVTVSEGFSTPAAGGNDSHGEY